MRHGGEAGRAARALALSVACLSVPALAGCGVVLQAPRFVADVLPQGVRVDVVSRDSPVPTGETVVLVHNQSDTDVRVLLLEDAPPVPALPRSVLDAVSSRDARYVVSVSDTVKKRKDLLTSGGLGFQIFSTSFHVHLGRGHRYTLVAVHGGVAEGLDFRSGAAAG